MSTSPEPANDASAEPLIPDFAELEADPEIAPLLEFTPVPRSVQKANGWTPDLQRMFIGWLAWYGSATNACDELGKARSGIDKIYKAAEAEEFRAAWDGAIALFERRRIAGIASRHSGAGALRAPTVSRGGNAHPHPDPLPHAGEGEQEDEAAYRERIEDARDSISGKLQRCRRLYLQEISGSPGKRAAFEILTELPIDWEAAARLEPQADEPWRRPNMRQPDMLLAAENGWLGGMAHGPDKVAELRAAIDRHRAERGMDPVEWDASPSP